METATDRLQVVSGVVTLTDSGQMASGGIFGDDSLWAGDRVTGYDEGYVLLVVREDGGGESPPATINDFHLEGVCITGPDGLFGGASTSPFDPGWTPAVGVDWADPAATILVCAECGRIEWFAHASDVKDERA